MKSKKLVVLLLVATLALTMTACGGSKKNDKPKKDVEIKNTLSLSENEYFFDIDEDFILDENSFDIEDGSKIEIEGDYDLKKAGKYIVKVIVTDKDGNKVESEKHITVDNKDKIEEAKKEYEETKPSSPSISVEQPEKNDNVEDGEQEISKNEVKPTPTPTPTVKPTVKPTEKPNESAGNYGLDESNVFVKTAISMVGETGICMDKAYELVSAAGYDGANYSAVTESDSWDSISSMMQVGDIIWYHEMNGNIEHQGVYLGNGKAFQGNWNNGKAVITDAYQSSNWYGLYRYGYSLPDPEIDFDIPEGEEYANSIYGTGFKKEDCAGLDVAKHGFTVETGFKGDNMSNWCAAAGYFDMMDFSNVDFDALHKWEEEHNQ